MTAKSLRYFLRATTLAGLAGLAGCGALKQGVQVSWPSLVPKIQAFYGDLHADAGLWVALHPADAPAIAKVEAVLDPEIAQLASDTAPTQISAVLSDLQGGVNALPPGMISPAHAIELNAVLELAQGVLQLSAAPQRMMPVDQTLAAPQPVHHLVRI